MIPAPQPYVLQQQPQHQLVQPQHVQSTPRPYPYAEHPQLAPGQYYPYDQAMYHHPQQLMTMPPSNSSLPVNAAAQFPSMANAISVSNTSLGQTPPPGIKPRVTTTLWEDEGTLCFQVEARGICVARREDNNMINGTKLLNVAGMTRGRRDGILKSEKVRHVVKIGTMYLKGVWIPYERALEFSARERIVDLLYPLFVADIKSFLYHPLNYTRTVQVLAAAERKKQVDQMRIQAQQPPQQSGYYLQAPPQHHEDQLPPPPSDQRLQSPYIYSHPLPPPTFASSGSAGAPPSTSAPSTTSTSPRNHSQTLPAITDQWQQSEVRKSL